MSVLWWPGGGGGAKAVVLAGGPTSATPATAMVAVIKPARGGHVGTLRSALLPNGKRALVIGARTHFYEGHGVRRVVHSVRTAAAAGATTMIGRPISPTTVRAAWTT